MTSPALAVETSYGRGYVHPVTGETVPSVTTIMKVGLAKPQLVSWAARMSAEYAVKQWDELSELPDWEKVAKIRDAHVQVADKAADIGDVVHDLIDAWNKGDPYPDPRLPRQIDGFVNSFVKFMTERRPEFIESEVTLWSRTYDYAGTADWIAVIGGRVILGDNKTGKRVYDEVGLQLAALANADFIIREDGSEEPLPVIEGLAALHLRPRSYRLVEVLDREECFRAFLACRELFEWHQVTAPEVLGK